MRRNLLIIVIIMVAMTLLPGFTVTAGAKAKHTFKIEGGNFVYDGNPIQIHSGEMHYSRVPAAYWHHRLRMMKALGLNAVATYGLDYR